MVAPDTTSPSPLVTSHPLDGEDQPALENVVLDKVRLCLERVTKSALVIFIMQLMLSGLSYCISNIDQ